MKILFDTTYFLPLIKINIENIPDNLLQKILSESSNECRYSDLSILELTAKGLRFSSQETEIIP